MKVIDYIMKKHKEDRKVYKSTTNDKRIQLIKYVIIPIIKIID